jgi:uncharacterized membrane protein HdeD (DUF308 family)
MEGLILIIVIMAVVVTFIFILTDHEATNNDDHVQTEGSKHDNRRDIGNVNQTIKRGRVEISTILSLVPVALLFYAPAHKGAYGFYIALRIIVCVVSVYRIYKLYEKKSEYTWLSLIYIAAILLFQPFWSWGIERESWAWIDVLYGIVFLIYSIRCIVLDLKAK